MTPLLFALCLGLAYRLIRSDRENRRLKAARRRTALRMWALREGRNVARWCAIEFHDERNQLLAERGELMPVAKEEMWSVN